MGEVPSRDQAARGGRVVGWMPLSVYASEDESHDRFSRLGGSVEGI